MPGRIKARDSGERDHQARTTSCRRRRRGAPPAALPAAETREQSRAEREREGAGSTQQQQPAGSSSPSSHALIDRRCIWWPVPGNNSQPLSLTGDATLQHKRRARERKKS